MRIVEVGGQPIGEGHAPYFVAELGICHDGDVNKALMLAEASAKAGTHCVKTEMFNRARVVLDPSAVASYSINGERITVPLAEHMERFELTHEEHRMVRERCRELGVSFMCTVHDFEDLEFMQKMGAEALKVASPDIVHYPLLRACAAVGVPVFLDTGAALQHEVELAVRCLREAGCEDIVVNHNPDGHPALAENHDLNIIGRLRDILGVPVGLADHFEGYEMAWASVVAGADTVEKPVSEDRFIPGPEKNYSVSMDELPQFLVTLQDFYKALGRKSRELSASQCTYRDNNRSAVAAAQDLAPGAPITTETVIFGRPRKGIGVEHWDLIEGRTLRVAKKSGEFINWEDLA